MAEIDSADSQSFNNGTFRNVTTFGVDNSSSSHAENPRNNFIVLVEGPTFRFNGSFGSPQKKFSINFSKANTKLYLSLHYNADNSSLFVNEKELSKFKAENKNVIFPNQFCLGIISNGFSAVESREVSLKGMCMMFQSITILLTILTY